MQRTILKCKELIWRTTNECHGKVLKNKPQN